MREYRKLAVVSCFALLGVLLLIEGICGNCVSLAVACKLDSRGGEIVISPVTPTHTLVRPRQPSKRVLILHAPPTTYITLPRAFMYTFVTPRMSRHSGIKVGGIRCSRT